MSEEKKTIWQQIDIIHKRPEDMDFATYKQRMKDQRDLLRMYKKHGKSFKPVLTKKMEAARQAYNLVQEALQKAQETEQPKGE